MEHDTKTRKSVPFRLFFGLQAVASGFVAYQYSAIWVAILYALISRKEY
jgi:hypothetical protein